MIQLKYEIKKYMVNADHQNGIMHGLYLKKSIKN